MPLPYIFIRMYMTRKKKEVTELPISAMEKLAKVMNDSPTIVKMSKTDFPITALKPATQWLIAEEACKILKAEKGNMQYGGDARPCGGHYFHTGVSSI